MVVFRECSFPLQCDVRQYLYSSQLYCVVCLNSSLLMKYCANMTPFFGVHFSLFCPFLLLGSSCPSFLSANTNPLKKKQPKLNKTNPPSERFTLFLVASVNPSLGSYYHGLRAFVCLSIYFSSPCEHLMIKGHA